MSYLIGKVWGQTSPLLCTPMFEIHKVVAKAGGYCSKHRHERKWNGFFVANGQLIIKMWATGYDLVDETTLNAGDFTTISPGDYHAFIAPVDCVFLEFYYLEPLANDIVRETVGGIGKPPWD